MSVFKLSKKNRFHVISEYYNEIKWLNDKTILSDLWVGKNAAYEFSYSDLVCNLLEDSFIIFITEDILILNFNNELISHLILLKDMLNDYNKKLPKNKWMDDKILADPEFDKVIEQAGKVVELWGLDEEAKKFINLNPNLSLV